MTALKRIFTSAMCMLVTAAFAGAADGPTGDPIPDDWFFSGAQRPAVLKAMEGKPAAALSVDEWIGTATTLESQRGKVVVVDFWATWCGPCMAAVPENVEMVSKYKDQGLVFIGVHDANSGWDAAPGVVKDKGINYAVAKDKSGSVSATAYNVQFWPTYVVIDREGIVRAAGLIPNHVEDVVKILLAESGPSMAEVATGFGPEYYYGGASRPSTLRDLEGKAPPPLTAQDWLGGAVSADTWKNSVVVLHFTSPSGTPSRKQLPELAKVEAEYASQGVLFIGVSSAAGAWDEMENLAKSANLSMPIMHDALPQPGTADADGAKPVEGAAAAVPQGVTAAAYGVRYFPASIVVDRAGVVRAAGVRTEKLGDVLTRLLAEATK